MHLRVLQASLQSGQIAFSRSLPLCVSPVRCFAQSEDVGVQMQPDSGQPGAFFDVVRKIKHFFPNEESANRECRAQFGSYLYLRRMSRDFTNGVEFLRSQGFESVLDIGCGDGYFTASLRNARFLSVGIDVHCPPWLRQVWKRISNTYSCEFVVADAQHLPFRSGTFDAIFAYAVIEHVGDPSLALQHFGSVLRDSGGLLIYGCPRDLSYVERSARWLRIPSHENLISEEQLKRWLSHAGFDIILLERASMVPYFIPLARVQSLWNSKTNGLSILDEALIKSPLSILAHDTQLVALKRNRAYSSVG